MNEKVPKIRFKGFTGSWEKSKLDDISSIITKQTGFDYSETIKPSLITTKEKGTYSFIQNKDFDGENINLNTDFYIPVSVAKKFPKITIDTPSILISISGKIGNVGYYSLKEKSFIGGAVGICKLLKGNGSLIVYALQSNSGQAYFNSLIKASSHANITVEDIRKIEVLLPTSLEEEEKIGEYFKNLGNLINNHQDKYDKLINKKKSMLEKMFPKEGQNRPEIRFKGFTEPWKKFKLEEISESLEYGLNAAAKKFDGENKYLRITDIDEKTRKFISEDLTSPDININNADKFKLKNGDIVFARTGASVGKTYIYDDSDNIVYYAGFLIRARIKPEYSAEFIFQNTLTDRYKKYIHITSQRSGQPGVNAQEYSEFSLMVPTYEEQIKIGEYFKNLDNLINQNAQQLGKLKNIKKALLEKMFV